MKTIPLVLVIIVIALSAMIESSAIPGRPERAASDPLLTSPDYVDYLDYAGDARVARHGRKKRAANPEPWKSYRRNSGRSYGRSYGRSSGRSYNNNRGRQPNRFLKDVGRAKIGIGAGLAGVGLLTGNQGLTNTGVNVAALGVGSSLLAHVFGKK